MKLIRGKLVAAIVCVAVVAGFMAVAAQSQEDGEPVGGGEGVVFDVGDPQGIDSMSPLIGVTVPALEAWNIQYATLTDKAAKDFPVIPGLAESWTARTTANLDLQAAAGINGPTASR